MKNLFLSLSLALITLSACSSNNASLEKKDNVNNIQNNQALSFLNKLPANSKFQELNLEDHCAYLQAQAGTSDPFTNFNYYIEQDDKQNDHLVMDLKQQNLPFLGQGGSYIAIYNQDHTLDGLCFRSSLQNFENSNMALAMYYDALKIKLGEPSYIDYEDGFASFHAMWELHKSGFATKYVSINNESVIIKDNGYEKNYGQNVSFCVMQKPLYQFKAISDNKIKYASDRLEQINKIVQQNTAAQNTEQIVQAKKQILNLLEL